MLEVLVNRKKVEYLSDTGATYTWVKPSDASHLPMSKKRAKTVGFSGQVQLIPFTAPVEIAIG